MSTLQLRLSDEELMRSCRVADPQEAREMIGELAQRHLERLTGFLFGITGDASGALDLAQEAFLRVFRKRGSYREIARFSTWLYTIGRNLALNELRNRKRRPALVAEDPDAQFSSLWSRLAGGGASPTRNLERTELQGLVRAAVLELPQGYREAVILCDLEQRSYAEAAEILDVPIGTVRSRLSRARARLELRLRKVL